MQATLALAMVEAVQWRGAQSGKSTMARAACSADELRSVTAAAKEWQRWWEDWQSRRQQGSADASVRVWTPPARYDAPVVCCRLSVVRLRFYPTSHDRCCRRHPLRNRTVDPRRPPVISIRADTSVRAETRANPEARATSASPFVGSTIDTGDADEPDYDCDLPPEGDSPRCLPCMESGCSAR